MEIAAHGVNCTGALLWYLQPSCFCYLRTYNFILWCYPNNLPASKQNIKLSPLPKDPCTFHHYLFNSNLIWLKPNVVEAFVNSIHWCGSKPTTGPRKTIFTHTLAQMPFFSWRRTSGISWHLDFVDAGPLKISLIPVKLTGQVVWFYFLKGVCYCSLLTTCKCCVLEIFYSYMKSLMLRAL